MSLETEPLLATTVKDATTTTVSYEATQSTATSATASPPESVHEEYGLPPAKLYILAFSLFTGSFLSALDTTIVTTLLTTIAGDLHSISKISWIATSYLLSCSAFQPLFGKLSDIFGRKVLLLICCGAFALGCLICVTDSITMLVIGRFITGIGGGGLNTLSTITMSDLIPLRKRGVFQGIGNIFFGIGSASGGIVGGLISDNFGWKYVFIFQIPLALFVGILIFIFLELPLDSPGRGAHGSDISIKLKRIDVWGSLLLVSALMTIMSAAAFGGREIAYTSPTFAILIVVSLILLSGFAYVELYVAPEPTIPLHLLGDRTVLSSSFANWFYTMGVFTYLFYVPIYFNSVLQLNPTETGKRLIPNFFGVSVGSVGAGLYMKSTGRYYKLTVITGIVSILGALRLFLITPEISLFTQYTLMIPQGIGYASILTVTLLALIASVPPKDQAATTSIQYAFRATGSTLGVSIATSIFQKILLVKLTNGIHELYPDNYEKAERLIKSALETGGVGTELGSKVMEIVNRGYDSACHGAFLFTFVCICLGAGCSFFMREHILHDNLKRT